MNPFVTFVLGSGPNAGQKRPAVIVQQSDPNDPNSPAELLVFVSADDGLAEPCHVRDARFNLRAGNGEWSR